MVWKFDRFYDNIAVISESGDKFTYAQLEKDSSALAEVFHADRCLVFCMCTNSYGSILGYLSFLNNRIVPVMIDAHLDRELLSKLYKNYRPDYIWAPDDIEYPMFSELGKVYGVHGYSLLKTGNEHCYPLYEELALLLTTSGSTGSPKLVRQSYANVAANTKSIIEYLEIDENEISITTMPMSYTYGLSIINTHISAGACIVATEKTLMHKEFWEQFRRNRVTSFGGVPYIYEMLNKLRMQRMGLPSLKTMTQAGGKLSPILHEKFARYAVETGRRFFVMYGQTEATARMAYLPAEKSLEKCGSIGVAIPGGKFELISVDGTIITETDKAGELVYYGENVTLGYAKSGEDLCLGDEHQGRLMTGDIATVDADGYYYIIGRKKRFLKLFGSRINLDETERLIKEQFPKLDCVCGGIDDKMYVFITDMEAADRVMAFLTRKTSFNHSAFKIQHIETVPRSDSGKVMYNKLERYYR